MKKNPDLVKFGLNIRRLRLKKGLSQAALARRAGISANYVGTLERGVQNPSLTSLASLAKGLGCSMSEEVRLVMELGWTSPAFRSMFGTNNGIAGQVLVGFGTDRTSKQAP